MSKTSLAAVKRLQQEYKLLKEDPERYISAEPDPQNILIWHYVITGPPNTPYHNGLYHGYLKFPSEYPFKPPSIQMLTPNGRFLTNKPLCLSMSNYHPETWNPAWCVGKILVGLLSFMTSEESGKALGMLKTSNALKQKLADDSFEFNRNTKRLHGEVFNELFCIFMWEEEERREHRLNKRRRDQEQAHTQQQLNSSSSSSVNSVTSNGDQPEQPLVHELRVTNGEENRLMVELKEAEEKALGKFKRARVIIQTKDDEGEARLQKIDALIKRQKREALEDI